MILATFACGCAAYEEVLIVGRMLEWGVTRCADHLESGTLPKEAEEYFDVGREGAHE